MASGSAAGRRGALARAGARLVHHEVAAGHERLLVRGRDDLARPERGEDRPERHDAAGAHDHEVDVVAGRERSRASAPPTASSRRAGRGPRRRRPGSRRRAGAGPPARSARRRCGRSRAPPRRKRSAWASSDVDRLAPDAPRRAEEGDAERRAVGRQGRGGHTGRRRGAANRNESMRSRMPPWPGISVPESLAPAARLSIDSARSPAWAASPSSGPRMIAPAGACAEAREQQGDDDRARDEPADQPFDRLRGRDVGQELVPADLAPDEVGARVVAPHAEHEEQDPAALGAEARQRRAGRPPAAPSRRRGG